MLWDNKIQLKNMNLYRNWLPPVLHILVINRFLLHFGCRSCGPYDEMTHWGTEPVLFVDPFLASSTRDLLYCQLHLLYARRGSELPVETNRIYHRSLMQTETSLSSVQRIMPETRSSVFDADREIPTRG